MTKLSEHHADVWQSLRDQMPVAEHLAYLDHAAVAPIPQPCHDAIVRYAHQAAHQGATVWPEWSRGYQHVRLLGAELIGADPAEIALIRNTTEGIGLVAEGLPWCDGDNVVTLADEFPSNQYPWLNLADRGVQTRRVPTTEGLLDLNQLAEACDERTRLVAISWVGYATGIRHDLEAIAEIAQRHGTLLLVDAIQGLGVFPLDVRQTPIDFLAADGHKWMLGPEGAGLMYIRRDCLDRLRPLGVGWHSVVQSHDFTDIALKLKPSAERYEGGSQNMVGFLGLEASLEMLMAVGAEALSQRVLDLTRLARERLQTVGARIVSHPDPQRQSGIVSFEMKGRDPAKIRHKCLEQGVVLSCRDGRLRISPHAYNNPHDIDRLIAALR